MGVPRGCPLPEGQRPNRCKYCQMPLEERKLKCPWTRGYAKAMT